MNEQKLKQHIKKMKIRTTKDLIWSMVFFIISLMIGAVGGFYNQIFCIIPISFSLLFGTIAFIDYIGCSKQ